MWDGVCVDGSSRHATSRTEEMMEGLEKGTGLGNFSHTSPVKVSGRQPLDSTALGTSGSPSSYASLVGDGKCSCTGEITLTVEHQTNWMVR